MNKKLVHEINWHGTDHKVETKQLEDGTKKLSYIISGAFMQADTPNRNNRVYPKEVANEAIAKLRPMVEEGRIRMLVDHPGFFDGGPSLLKSGAILKEITDVQEDGFAYYKAKILNNESAKVLKDILDEGGKIGVSTRGYGYGIDKEVEGHEGTFEVISDFELNSVDFVDDPSVLDTEKYMHIESNIRSKLTMFKTVEELRTALPNLVKQLVDSTTLELNTEFDKKIEEMKATLEEKTSLVEAKTALFDSLIEKIKEISPDKFKVVEESAIVTERDAEIVKITASLTEAIANLDSSKLELKTIQDDHIKAVREAYIEQLKATDEAFFKFESFENCFENCITKDEVKSVYESNSKIVKEMTENSGKPADSKSKQTEDSAEKSDKDSLLTEAQLIDFNGRNKDRRSMRLPNMTEAKYLEMFGKK